MVRCAACRGSGQIGSSRIAVRNVVGALTEADVGDPKLFADIKSVYTRLALRPKNAEVSADPNVEHHLIEAKRLAPRQFRASCSCGRSTIRGTETAAKNEILRHIGTGLLEQKGAESSDPKPTETEHALREVEHLGPRQFRGSCTCGESTIRGTETAAKSEIQRHVEKATVPIISEEHH